jgi:membrane protease YdiL (CAAX protease family)
MKERLYRFFVRDDAEYDTLVRQYQAKTLAGKFFYLFMHVLPGLLAYVLINIPLVHAAALRFTGLSDPMFQGTCLIGVVFVWHAVVPLAVLRWADKLSFQESLAFLSLRKFDTRGFLLVLPIGFVVFTAVSLPYMKYIFPPLTDWVASIPGLNPPEYSIFRDPSGVYSLLPAWFVGLGLVGNFLCEELYFHGYLMKKIGFLGAWAWVVNSALFALYHVWQAPTTWALFGLVFFFGLLMQWRKNLYPLIAFHFLVNIVWGAIIGAVLK